MKKLLGILLVFALSFSTMTTAFGQANNLTLIGNVENEGINVQEYKEYTLDDILKLEPYVFVEDGYFKIDTKEAIKNGIELSLIQGQQEYFNTLNQQADNGKIVISKDLAIKDKSLTVSKNLNMVTTLAATSCKGKSAGPTKYWWGHKTWADSCDTKKLISNANTAGAAGGMTGSGVGVLGIFFPILLAPAGIAGLTGGYFWLFATRLDANNKGKGVIVEMTWAAVYDISPQY